MANREMLQEFLSDDFFREEVTLTTRTNTYVRGRSVTSPDVTTPIVGVVQPTTPRELINLGLGQYTDKENFIIHTATNIIQSDSHYITFKGKFYKIVSKLPWDSYGFFRYVITLYNEGDLNDN